MNRQTLKTCTFVVLLLLCNITRAENKLGSLIKDHMVLQREATINLWGWDNPGQKVKVITSWGEEKQTSTDNDGKWTIQIPTTTAGGPYQIEVKGSSNHHIDDVLLGDVWICSGQSNMYMPIKGYSCQPVENSNELILSANNNKIRYYHIPVSLNTIPQDNIQGKWVVSSSQEAPEFSAIAYTFAREIQRNTGIPIGIIATSKGASKIEAWMDPTALKEFSNISIPQTIPKKNGHKAPTLLFNTMIHPIVKFKAKGFLWYQGEANTFEPDNYARLSRSMIGRWRQLWEDQDMPFYYVQIAPYSYKGRKAAVLREQQAKILDIVPNTGMAVTMDIGSHDCIHPQDKETVGKRLAYIALKKTYGYSSIICDAPMLEKADGLGTSSVKLYLKNIGNGLTGFDKRLLGFEVAGPDKKFHHAIAMINRKDKTITVECNKVISISSVRYGFRNYIPSTLYNSGGIPASSFRTDNWK
ncbi:sialate O-acetylesterase [Halosquirtibacter xylanolyticus]|uniref:sialate O-acetylesterase n=1 Tax=Halosquirtibacter xylanolyticus TaxID=3374599 RepID=UPI003749D73C|nr:sialate O-acetylesterase [Prolixibacteraceae bacterium]